MTENLYVNIRAWPKKGEMRRVPALLLLSLLSGVLLAGCLDASQADRPAEASSGSVSGGPANKSLSGGVPESTVGTSRINGDLAGTDNRSLRVPFVEKTEDSGGSGYDADTVLAVRYRSRADYERAVIDLGTGQQPAGAVPGWTLTSSKGEGDPAR